MSDDSYTYEAESVELGNSLKAELAPSEEEAPKVAEELDTSRAVLPAPFERESCADAAAREIASRMGDKTAAERISIELMKQDLAVPEVPGIDIDEYINATRADG